jgi:hypothetical protein
VHCSLGLLGGLSSGELNVAETATTLAYGTCRY